MFKIEKDHINSGKDSYTETHTFTKPTEITYSSHIIKLLKHYECIILCITDKQTLN